MSQVFLVGGAVRDTLLCKAVKDCDFVVVGSTVEQMLSNGFQQVGKDFPVFLHPETREEYALARREQKTGNGYTDFECTTEGVSLEDDLRRRDLTINAMAQDCQSRVVFDPFNGIKDIRGSVLRHVDASGFAEDPVRILRVARFLSQLPDFSVAPETFDLCSRMVAEGAVSHLTVERVQKEMEKALEGSKPSRFFVFLRAVGALDVLFPEVAALAGKTQPFRWHPEGDAFVHTMLVVDRAAASNHEDRLLHTYCALAHDLGKGLTAPEMLPHHYGHEAAGVPVVHKMFTRLRVPVATRRIAEMVTELHGKVHALKDLRPVTVLRMMDRIRSSGNLQRAVVALAETARHDSQGRGPMYEDVQYSNADLLVQMVSAVDAVKVRDLVPAEELPTMPVAKIINVLQRARVNVIQQFRSPEKQVSAT